MASVKFEFRTHGNEAKPADFQMLLTRLDVKKMALMNPEQKRRLYEYLEKCEYIFASFKNEVHKAMEGTAKE